MSNNYPKMVSYQTVQAVTGSLSGSANMATTTVNVVTSYSFSITISNLITSGGYMKMTFPKIISITNSTSCAVISGISMNSIPLCTFNAI